MFTDYFDFENLEELKNKKSVYILVVVAILTLCFLTGALFYYYLCDLTNEGIRHRKEMDKLNRLSIHLYDNIKAYEEDYNKFNIEHIC